MVFNHLTYKILATIICSEELYFFHDSISMLYTKFVLNIVFLYSYYQLIFSKKVSIITEILWLIIEYQVPIRFDNYSILNIIFIIKIDFDLSYCHCITLNGRSKLFKRKLKYFSTTLIWLIFVIWQSKILKTKKIPNIYN